MEIDGCLENSALTYSYKPIKFKYDLEKFLYVEAFKKLKQLLRKQFRRKQSMKIIICLQIELSKLKDGETISILPHFRSTTHALPSSYYICNTLFDSIRQVISHYDNFVEMGSGWTLTEINHLDMEICEYVPLSGGCRFTRLPKGLYTKRAILSIESPPKMCFLYSVLAKLHPVKKHPERMTNYKRYERTIDCDMITFPVKITQLPRFEQSNNLSINIFGFEKRPFPIFVSERKVLDENRKIDLLLWKSHFFLIRDISRLIGYSFNENKRHKCYVCRKCLYSFKNPQMMKEHERYCTSNGQRYTLPPKGSTKQFTNFRALLKNDFVFYCDFESFMVKQNEERYDGKMTKQFKHEPIAVCVKRICRLRKFDGDLYYYQGEDCAVKFLEYLRCQETEIAAIYDRYAKKIAWTDDDRIKFRNTNECEFCHLPLRSRSDRKVADHDHLTGKFRFTLCNRCNLTFASTNNRKVPIVAHGGGFYDSKLILSALGKNKSLKYRIRVYAKSKEKFLCIFLNNFMLIDSYNFLPASLQTLTNSLKMKGDEYFKPVRDFVQSEEQFQLMLRKGVFCYEYLDSVGKLSEQCLPPIQAFYDSLKSTHITSQDYDHARRVWRAFECETLEDYLRVYLIADVLILTSVFEEFRTMTYTSYSLEVSGYFSLPHMAFDALLRKSNTKLELLNSIDMYNFISRGIRGGVSCIFHRYAKANNPYMRDYDSNVSSSYIMYYDVCNLYGYVMASTRLPISNFRWLSTKEIDELDIVNVPRNSDEGYILECSLEIDERLHDVLSEFPLAPEQMSVSTDMWSCYMEKMANIQKLPKKTGASKLIPTLFNKDGYVLHYLALQLYVKLGVKIKSIQKVLAFKQEKWMKDFIRLNGQLRKEAKSEFDQDLYKLMTNSVYGKCLQNPCNKMDYRIVNSKKKFLRLTSKPNFKAFSVITKNLVGVHMDRTSVCLDQIIYAGMVILDCAKTHLYKFHYNYMRPMYGNSQRLLMTDTDSLMYWIKTEQDIYVDMKHNKKYFDTSNYPREHPLFDLKRKRKVGLMKDETGGDPIVAFVGLRSKMYTFLTNNDDVTIRAKGLQASIAKKLKFDDYVSTLSISHVKTHEYSAIRSLKNNLYTVSGRKKGISGFDDKRFIRCSGIDTLAFGHYLLRGQSDNVCSCNQHN